jgi:Zn-dependent protease with chaperone function
MNVPNLSFWWHLLATLGLEISCLAGLGFLAQRLFRSAAAQRAVWQMAVLCLLLVTASDFTGFGRGAAQMFFGQKQVLAIARPVPLPPHSAVLTRPLPVKMNPALSLPRHATLWPGWLWLAGTLIVLGRIAAAQALLLTLRLRREKIASRSLQERVGQIAHRVGLRRKVNLLWMPQTMGPMAFGLVRPTIGLPLDFEAEYSAAEQDAVLAHELAHLAARDPRWFLLADFATALLWWHPLAWWVRRSFHLTAELAADEETALVPDGPGALAKCLVTLGKKMAAPRGWGWIGINGGFQSRLGVRVERLLRLSKTAERPRTMWSSAPPKVIATFVVLPAVVLLFGAMQTARGQKQDTWQNEMSASWNSSPGAQLLSAALDPKLDDQEKPEVNIATQVQNAKLLYEMGKINEAKAILTQVSNKAPSNQAARYYLDLIRTAPSKLQPQPIPLSSTAQPMFIPLTWDEKPMFIPLDATATPVYVQTFLAPNNLNFGLGLPAQDAVQPPQPAQPQQPATLCSKVFKTDPSVFYHNLTNVCAQSLSSRDPNDKVAIHKMVRAYFTAAGVNLTDPGKTLFYNDRTGLLYMRATEQDLEIIQEAIKSLDPVPPQIAIEAKFTESSPKEIYSVGLSDYLVGRSNNSELAEYAIRLASAKHRMARAKNDWGTNLPAYKATQALLDNARRDYGTQLKRIMDGIRTRTVALGNTGGMFDIAVAGVLENSQFTAIISAIGQHTDSDVLSEPKVTTLSGREMHVSSGGTELDLTASVEKDGFALLAQGYASIKTETQSWFQNFGSSELLDGQTLVFGGPADGREPEKRVPVVFVTLRIIDATGNAVHTDEEISKHVAALAQ